MTQLSRRTLGRGAIGLTVAFAMSREAVAGPSTVAGDQVDAYLSIAPDGRVTVFAGKVDLGTGARAAIPQIVAEELDIPPEWVALVEGNTALTPDQGSTGGSTGISVGGMQIRQAAATARAALARMAAERLSVAESELLNPVFEMWSLGQQMTALHAVGGAGRGLVPTGPRMSPQPGFRTRDGRTVTYAELIGGRDFALAVDAKARVKKPELYRVVGRSLPRPDLPAKLTGRHTYIHDHRVPGMLHARVVRPPAIGAIPTRIDDAAVTGIPGATLVRVADFVAVVAPREWDAVRALRALRAPDAIVWSDAATLPGSAALYDTVRNTSVARAETLRATGDAAKALGAAPRVIAASYNWPIQSHASMGPSCAVADISDGAGTVWTASQGTHKLRQTIARLLKLDAAKLRVVYMDGSGSYGTNGNDDAAFEAALLSRELGRPVRVQWMRDDELGWDPKGPPQCLDLRAALAQDGTIAAWETTAMVPANTPNLANVPLIAAMAAGLESGAGMSAGLTSLNADPPYAIADMRADIRWLASTPLRPSNLRAPGKIGNVFAVESFTDELAHEAGADPLAYRIAMLRDPRGLAVLRRAGEMMGWTPRDPSTARDASAAAEKIATGQGIAYVHYKQSENYVAMGVELTVDRSTGAIRVVRVAVAHDCGLMINPDAVRGQVEGCIIQTLSRTLLEEVSFDRQRVTSVDWASYPILTFPDIPRLDIALIDHPNERPLGAGEAATAPVAAAVGNAVFDAVGARLRTAPFTPARVLAAMPTRAT